MILAGKSDSGIRLGLIRPECPECGRSSTRIDLKALSNLIRLPAAVLSGAIVFPLVGVRMRCVHCGRRFLASALGEGPVE